MNLYKKILTAHYYYISKTNWLHPIYSIFMYISILHILNILSILILLDIDLKLLSEKAFIAYWIILGGISMFLHYKFILKESHFNERLKLIKVDTIKKIDYLHLIYELLTFAFLFYALEIDWGYYFYLCLALIGINSIHKVFISENN